MHVKSPYPPVPPVPDDNVHNLLSTFQGEGEPTDYVLHIDALSGRRRTRSEFLDRIAYGSTALGTPVSQGGLGFRGEAGDIVGIYSNNCMDFIALIHSLLMITTPFSLISAYSTSFELVHALRLTKVTRLFCQPSLLPKALKAAKEIGLPEERIFVLEGHAPGRKSFGDLIDDAIRQKIPKLAKRPAKKNTLAYLAFSSGTSGLPKAVMVSHGNVWFMTVSAMIGGAEDQKALQIPPRESPPVYLAMLPFYHTYGLHSLCLRGLAMPATFVIMPKWDVKVVLRAIHNFSINVLPMIPSAVHQLVNYKGIEQFDLSSVYNISVGAAYLPPKLADKIQSIVKTIPRIYEGYGMTEATLSACRTPAPGALGYLQPARGSCGVLVPGMEARIVRDDGSDAEVNEPGELWVKGGNVAMGYFGNEKATKEAFVDGWYKTGDKLKVDAKGNFFFVDRAKDTLKVSGIQVSPTEIEDVLRAHPGKLILDVSVSGVSGGRTSDEKNPRAWIVLSEAGKLKGEAATIRTLDDWVRQNLSKYKWLRGGFEVIDQIPKSPTGKVLRRVLQDSYEQRMAARTKL